MSRVEEGDQSVQPIIHVCAAILQMPTAIARNGRLLMLELVKVVAELQKKMIFVCRLSIFVYLCTRNINIQHSR